MLTGACWGHRVTENIGGVGVRILGINAVFHDPAAALVIDGKIVAAAEEERFSRRKHGKRPVPFSTWEVPELAARVVPGRSRASTRATSMPSPTPTTRRWLTDRGGISRRRLGRSAHAVRRSVHRCSSAPRCRARSELRRVRTPPRRPRRLGRIWPRRFTTQRAGARRPGRVGLSPGRPGYAAASWRCWPAQRLPHSLGLMYEEVTEHLGFMRSSDEYKVMALASYGRPTYDPRVAPAGSSDAGRRLRRRTH